MKVCDICGFTDRDKIEGGVKSFRLSAEHNDVFSENIWPWRVETQLCDECLSLVINALDETLESKFGIESMGR